MRNIIISCLLLSSVTLVAQDLEYPIIKNYGGVVNVPNTINPTKGGKMIIDITGTDVTKAGTNKSLDRVARLINLYGLAGIQPDELDIAVIIHGGATKTIITNEGFQEKYQSDNPDLGLIKALTDRGVKVMVCSQALARRGFKTEWLNPDVGLALSALTTLVDYQQRGYIQLIY